MLPEACKAAFPSLMRLAVGFRAAPGRTFCIKHAQDALPVQVKLQAVAAVGLCILHMVVQLPQRTCKVFKLWTEVGGNGKQI